MVTTRLASIALCAQMTIALAGAFRAGMSSSPGPSSVAPSGGGASGIEHTLDRSAIQVDGARAGASMILDFQPDTSRVVPSAAPDKPLTDTTTVKNYHEWGTAFTPNIVEIIFHSSASQGQRQAAVDAIGGTVVGGHPGILGFEGVYFVRLPVDPTNENVFKAMRTLDGFPAVEDSYPTTPNGIVPAHGRPPTL